MLRRRDHRCCNHVFRNWVGWLRRKGTETCCLRLFALLAWRAFFGLCEFDNFCWILSGSLSRGGGRHGKGRFAELLGDCLQLLLGLRLLDILVGRKHFIFDWFFVRVSRCRINDLVRWRIVFLKGDLGVVRSGFFDELWLWGAHNLSHGVAVGPESLAVIWGAKGPLRHLLVERVGAVLWLQVRQLLRFVQLRSVNGLEGAPVLGHQLKQLH